MYIALPEEGRKRVRSAMRSGKPDENAILRFAWVRQGASVNPAPAWYVEGLLAAEPSDVLRATEELLV